MSPLVFGIAVLLGLNILFKPVPQTPVKKPRGKDPTTHVHIYNDRVYQVDGD